MKPLVALQLFIFSNSSHQTRPCYVLGRQLFPRVIVSYASVEIIMLTETYVNLIKHLLFSPNICKPVVAHGRITRSPGLSR